VWVLREGLNIGRVGAALSSVGSTCAIVTVELIITPPLVVGSVGQPAAVSGRATKLKRCRCEHAGAQPERAGSGLQQGDDVGLRRWRDSLTDSHQARVHSGELHPERREGTRAVPPPVWYMQADGRRDGGEDRPCLLGWIQAAEHLQDRTYVLTISHLNSSNATSL
jgi:hypothetical protein